MVKKIREMQGTDEENQVKSRSDEDSINFRPSPNFKHMKKYLKSKFEETMMIEARSSSEEQNSPLSGNNKQKTVNVASTPVQPPLPPNPPPPDSLPLITNLKKEIVDDEYQCSTTETTAEFNNSEELKTVTIKTDQSETSTEKPNVTMCRNFARGTCKKGAACIFVHELILSQLPGVYTFCRNFQNSVLTYPKCKFVHATVFEKEYFFRTGYLPPHTLAHLKEATVQQPPPPPPQLEEKPTEVAPIYNNALPPPTIPCIPPAVVVPYAENGVERSDPNIFRTIHAATTTTSPNREWSESQEENQVKSRSDEDSINFRPSPNFKHMKKYLKPKFEEAMMIEARSSSEEQNSPLSGNNKQKTVNVASTPVQPPLPPNPPPPDSPPLITNLKKEIVDDEYQCSTTETAPEFNNSEELKTVTIKTDQSETSTEKPNVTMCRNFARGTCKKGAACIFVHELILSQLPGVYTFCRNFQNSVCSYPKYTCIRI